MALTSQPGQTPVETGGAMTSVGGADATQAPGVISLSAPLEAPAGEATTAGEETQVGAATAAGTDSLSGASTDTASGGDAGILEGAPSEDAIRESLTKQGGIFADARYLPAAIEVERTGKLSDATRAATAAAFGVPETYVDQFMATVQAGKAGAQQGQQAVNAQTHAEFHAIAGGPEEYAKFSTWAKGSLDANELAAYDSTLDANPAAAKVLLKGFVDRYRSAGNGPGPRDATTEGGMGAAPAVVGYASQDEMVKDMSDPRYSRDPAFRDTVMQKLANSNFGG